MSSIANIVQVCGPCYGEIRQLVDDWSGFPDVAKISEGCETCVEALKMNVFDCSDPETQQKFKLEFTISLTGLVWLGLFLHYRFNLFGLNQIGSQISAFVQNREDKKIEKIAEKVQAVNNRSV